MSTTKWVIDPTHSEIQFKVKHLVISTVTGHFRQFSGEAETGENDFTGATVRFAAHTDSIDTNHKDRDNHLKSPDFFDAAQFPEIRFASVAFAANKLEGDLTIKGVTRRVVLNVDFGGEMKDPYGNHKAGFEVTGKISRKDFGLNWSAVTEAGGVVVGDEVKLIANVQLVKQ
jgi:polyisoprenoid-binding protein YceI